MLLQALRNTAQTISGLINQQSGMGGAGDHSGAQVSFGRDLNPLEIAQWMDRERILRNAIEAKPDAIARVWRSYGEDRDDWIEADEKFDIKGNCETALNYAAAFGGAFIMPRFDVSAVDDEQISEEFRQPRAGSLLGWKIFCPQDLRTPTTMRGKTETQPGTDLPMLYEVKNMVGGKNLKIHHSWTIPVFGATCYSRRTGQVAHDLTGALGVSEVQMISDHLTRALSGLQQLSHMLAKANIDTLQSAGVSAAKESCEPGSPEMQQMITHMLQDAAAAVQGASVYQPVILDLEEKLDRLGLSSGATASVGMVETLIGAFVAATGVPRTLILGEQGKGLNNGGEADLRNFYDSVSALRESRLTPVLNRIDEIVAADQGLSQVEWEYKPLFEPSEKERAEIEAKNAERDAKYLSADIPYITSRVAERLQREKVYAFTDEQVKDIAETEELTGRDG